MDELCSVVDSPGISPDGVSGSVAWTDGTSSRFGQLDELRTLLVPERFGDILAVRISAGMRDSIKLTLVARQKVPGLVLQVEGSEPAAVLGVGELAFQRMMVGYVDRLGGFRGLAWMLFGLGPMIVVSWAVSRSEISLHLRLGLLVLALLSGLSLFALSGQRFLVSRPLVFLKEIPGSHVERWKIAVKSTYANKRVKAVLGVVGALILGVIGNKLSELIPFP